MDYFNFKQQQLFAEEIPVTQLAEQYDTPLYVYSRATIERHWHAFDQAAGDQPHLVCYAVKANSNLAILNTLAKLGSGFDIVSMGELARVLEAGGDPQKVVFSGVGKSDQEIRYALDVGIYCFNVESVPELERISAIAAELSLVAPISIRVNPDVDAGTHPYISTGLKENKFGISMEDAIAAYQFAAQSPSLAVKGIDCHIGSQLTELLPFTDALKRVLGLVEQLKAQGITISHIDVGGGLGVTYQDETPPQPAEYASALADCLVDHPELTIIFEPGRAIMANAGILVSKVEYLKETPDKNFAIIDAAMNDLIRPSLYSAWQEIVEVKQTTQATKNYDVVGPICETGDFLGKSRDLALNSGDLIAVRSSGAYGFTMASNYNSRVKAAEVMVDKDRAIQIRQRETLADLWRGEAKTIDD
ncbi:diaminopimelate decarboxylase [Psychrobium sp. 1_MG-2023]|uniref:diaminopimelate decarboxylase n=1 Tax=Psychrobium sp. 1_MG-2023 TaxID=3062624 RepID=UPI000C321FD3|nr:diaminopimelate decarboxylase [Psychrobium sp. 1_MG-2023]MDP2562009.1 diaminopimelate decarboxylase [Psychrobium sp. 1_MG-2023]PKF58611.1 diaminopimelate decarboxylase [Alteromonadales bacterium alter-6D02]